MKRALTYALVDYAMHGFLRAIEAPREDRERDSDELRVVGDSSEVPAAPGEAAGTVAAAAFLLGIPLLVMGFVLAPMDPQAPVIGVVLFLLCMGVACFAMAARSAVVKRADAEPRAVREAIAFVEEAEAVRKADPAAAAELVGRVCGAFPELLDGRLLYLFLRLEAGQADAVVCEARECLCGESLDRRDKLDLATALAWRGDLDEALAVFAALKPRVRPTAEYGYAFYGLYGYALLAAERPAEAHEMVQRVLRRKRSLDDDSVCRCLMVRARCRIELGRRAAARVDLERLAAHDAQYVGLKEAWGAWDAMPKRIATKRSAA